jgi:hypothetical protein
MMGFLAAGLATRTRLSAAQILGARQFVGRVVNDFVRG